MTTPNKPPRRWGKIYFFKFIAFTAYYFFSFILQPQIVWFVSLVLQVLVDVAYLFFVKWMRANTPPMLEDNVPALALTSYVFFVYTSILCHFLLWPTLTVTKDNVSSLIILFGAVWFVLFGSSILPQLFEFPPDRAKLYWGRVLPFTILALAFMIWLKVMFTFQDAARIVSAVFLAECAAASAFAVWKGKRRKDAS